MSFALTGDDLKKKLASLTMERSYTTQDENGGMPDMLNKALQFAGVVDEADITLIK